MATDMGGFAQAGGPLILSPTQSQLYNRVDYLAATATNTNIYLAQPPKVLNGSMLITVWKNGTLLFFGIDYSVSGATLTLTVAVVAGDHIVIDYWSAIPLVVSAKLQFKSALFAAISALSPDSFWKLQEVTGTFTDSGGSNNLTAGTSGITRGVTSIIPTQPEKCVTIGGADPAGVVTASIFPQSSTQNLTLVFAINATSLSGPVVVMHQGDAGTGGAQGAFLEITSAGAIRWQAYSGGYSYVDSPTGVVTTNTPMLITAKIDGGTTQTVKFYVNGSQVGTAQSWTIGTGNAVGPGFTLGALHNTGYSNAIFGQLQGAAVWKSLISDANILSLAQAGGFA